MLHKQKEAKPDYQFLANNNTRETPFPEELGDVTQPRVVWKGSMQADADGEHLFKMYSSGYATLRIDGEELLHRWRMNWNPWYHDVKVPLKAGESVPVEMEWDSQGGYFYVEHMPPQPEQDRYSLSFASESGKSIDYYVVVADNYDGVVAGYRELTNQLVKQARGRRLRPVTETTCTPPFLRSISVKIAAASRSSLCEAAPAAATGTFCCKSRTQTARRVSCASTR